MAVQAVRNLVAAFGFHAGLVLGSPTMVTEANVERLAAQLGDFKLKLFKNDNFVEEGSGRNVFRNPVLCLGELAKAVSDASWAEPLRAGELISTGSLNNADADMRPARRGRAVPEGLDVRALVMSFSAELPCPAASTGESGPRRAHR
jgi:2-keto-4-pentenoate hydratase